MRWNKDRVDWFVRVTFCLTRYLLRNLTYIASLKGVRNSIWRPVMCPLALSVSDFDSINSTNLSPPLTWPLITVSAQIQILPKDVMSQGDCARSISVTADTGTNQQFNAPVKVSEPEKFHHFRKQYLSFSHAWLIKVDQLRVQQLTYKKDSI